MTNFLAIETADMACSCALQVGQHISERSHSDGHAQAQQLMPMVHALLNEAGIAFSDIDAFVLSCGPGRFTGLRVAASIVQGLAFAHNTPVILLPTLQILAQGAYRLYQAPAVLCALDARLQEVYWGGYVLNDKTNCMQALLEPSVCAPNAVALPDDKRDWHAAGSGWKAYQENLMRRMIDGQCHIRACHEHLMPHALDALSLAQEKWRLGELVSAQNALPEYLRDKVTA